MSRPTPPLNTPNSTSNTPNSAPARRQVGARQARRELLPDQSPALLQELHLMTRDGRLNADALRKLKQVNHFMGLLQPALDDLRARHPSPQILDAGAGNAYLGFVLYELFAAAEVTGASIHNVDIRPELVTKGKERAQRLGYDRMLFHTSALRDAPLPERLHLVVALHACDTATDDALALAIQRGADHVAVVPCCQAEVSRLLPAAGGSTLGTLWQHAWHRREFASHVTNVIRALCLEASGYQVTVTELTGWEHSLKNELILGRRVHKENRVARKKLDALLEMLGGIRPALVRHLWPRVDGEPVIPDAGNDFAPGPVDGSGGEEGSTASDD